MNITLTPAAIAILDRRGIGRSQEIERLILASAEENSITASNGLARKKDG